MAVRGDWGSGGGGSRSSGGRIRGDWGVPDAWLRQNTEPLDDPNRFAKKLPGVMNSLGRTGNGDLITGMKNVLGPGMPYTPGYSTKQSDYYQQAYGQNARYESPIDVPVQFAKETGRSLLDAVTGAQRAAAPAKGDIKNGRLTDEFLARTGTEAYQYKPRSAGQQVASAARAGLLPLEFATGGVLKSIGLGAVTGALGEYADSGNIKKAAKAGVQSGIIGGAFAGAGKTWGFINDLRKTKVSDAEKAVLLKRILNDGITEELPAPKKQLALPGPSGKPLTLETRPSRMLPEGPRSTAAGTVFETEATSASKLRQTKEARAALAQMEKDAVSALKSFQKETGGVVMTPGRDGAKLRESTNPKWYRDFYAKFGRKPTNGDLLDIARDMLKNNSPELQGIGIDTEMYNATRKMMGEVGKTSKVAGSGVMTSGPAKTLVEKRKEQIEKQLLDFVRGKGRLTPERAKQLQIEHYRLTRPSTTASAEDMASALSSAAKKTESSASKMYADNAPMPAKAEGAPGIKKTAAPQVAPPGDSVQVFMDALAEAKPIRDTQERLYSAERSRRAAKIAAVGGKVQGEKGFYAQLSQLKGELPKVQFESIRSKIKQPVIDDLFSKVEASNLSPFDKVNAKSGLAKMLGEAGGQVPTRSELALLSEVFPKEFVEAIASKRPLMQKFMSMSGEVLNLPRAIMATVDLSAPFRQGVFMVGRPKQFLPAMKDMFKYAFNEKAYQNGLQQIKARPSYKLMKQSKLALTEIDGPMTSREEAFMSNLAEKIPGFGHLARGSDRAYTGFLNKLRADVFDDLVSKAKLTGSDNPNMAKDIATFVNAATGRGSLPAALEKAAPALNGVFFSPRLMASRLTLLNPAYYLNPNTDPFVRKEALKSLMGFAAVGSTVLGLAQAAGATVGTDPRSSDFGKIKIGDTRYDPWGGFQQYLVLGSRLLSGEMISSTTGKQMKLGENYTDPTRLDIIQRFLESKEAPIASLITSALKGKDATGQPFKLAPELVNRMIPMMAQDLYDLYQEWGTKGLAMGAPGVLGVGSQTYSDMIPLKGKTKTGEENVTWRQQPSLGEALYNAATGTEVTNVAPQDIPKLLEEKQLDTQYRIDLDKVKAEVLESGKTKTIYNPVKKKTTVVYRKNGVVKTRYR